MVYLPVILTVCSSLGYHFLLKEASGGSSPLALLFWSYLTAALMCLVVLFVTNSDFHLENIFKEKMFSPLLLAIAIVGIEGGYLLAYKNGGNISQTSMLTHMISLIVMLVFGFLLMKEPLTMRKVLGLFSALVSLSFLSRP